MNHTYRLVWNRTLCVMQVASELASNHGSGASGAASTTTGRNRFQPLALSCAIALMLGALPAHAGATTDSAGGNGAAVSGTPGGAGGAGYGVAGGNGSNGSGGGGGGAGAAGGNGSGASAAAGGAAGHGIAGQPGSSPQGAGGADATDPNGGGGGGGGGADGYVGAANGLAPGGTHVAGAGGNGGKGVSGGGGGGGGAGGDGARLIGTAGSTATLSGVFAGGSGGSGGFGVNPGNDGAAGDGIGINNSSNNLTISHADINGGTSNNANGGNGLRVSGDSNTIAIDNANIFGGQGGGYGSVAVLNGIGILISGNNNAVANSGAVVGGGYGSSTGGAGILVSGSGNAITNTGGGTIVGGIGTDAGAGAQGGDGLVFSGSKNTLSNSGQITGGSATISNSGTSGIGGNGLAVSGANNVINNTGAGQIIGGAAMGAKNNSSSLIASGGNGIVISGGLNTVNNSGNITGGSSGSFGGGYGSVTGSGGIGIAVTGTATGNVINNSGTIAGGAGTAPGLTGGVAIATSGGVTVNNAGTISGGMSGDATPVQANAIAFSGGGNMLVLEAGSLIHGKVIGTVNGGDTLALGGNINAAGGNSFDLTQIGQQYQGFTQLEKTGTSQWTLTNNGGGNWLINQGALQLGDGVNTAGLWGSTGSTGTHATPTSPADAGGVGGNAITLTAAASGFINSTTGHVHGGHGGSGGYGSSAPNTSSAGGNGGAGVLVTGTTQAVVLQNDGLIQGGDGGNGNNGATPIQAGIRGGNGGQGGNGGNAVTLDTLGSVVNSGTLVGGAGGLGGWGGNGYGSGYGSSSAGQAGNAGQGGNGGIGLAINFSHGALSTAGSITGGVGGVGGLGGNAVSSTGSQSANGGNGGAGGAGLAIGGSGNTLTNTATITGGAGGSNPVPFFGGVPVPGGVSFPGGSAGAGGDGGNGMTVSGGNTIDNQAAVSGGNGGNGAFAISGAVAGTVIGTSGNGGMGGMAIALDDQAILSVAAAGSMTGGTGGTGGNGGTIPFFGAGTAVTMAGTGGRGGSGAAIGNHDNVVIMGGGAISGGAGGIGGGGGFTFPAGFPPIARVGWVAGGVGATGGVGGSGIDAMGGNTIAISGTVAGGIGGAGGQGDIGKSGGAAGSSSQNGGSGGNGGNGGVGGRGIALAGSGNTINNSGVVTGGNGGNGGTGGAGGLGGSGGPTGIGGAGGNGGNGGNGSDGGIGIAAGSGNTINNNGTISGGQGGIAGIGGAGGQGGMPVPIALPPGLGGIPMPAPVGSPGIAGAAGAVGAINGLGGVGITSTGGTTVTNAGTISGGLSGDGKTQAHAIDFTGGGNTLELRQGYVFNGAVTATRNAGQAADTLALGGTVNSSFDVGLLAAGAAFGNFNQFQKNGSSTWVLTGAGVASESWTITQGTVQGDATSLVGNIVFAPAGGTSAGVIFDQGSHNTHSATTATYAGVISGTGSLGKIDDGTLILSGANTYSGGTTVSAGTLQGDTTSLQGNITDNATLVFNQASNGLFAGSIAGTGTLTKAGAGMLVLNGDSSPFTGTTLVQSGTLEVGDSNTPTAVLGGHVQVAAGGTLRGHGRINGDVVNDGMIWAGGSIGTLSIHGDFTQKADGSLTIDATPSGQVDLLAVSGKASILGGSAVVLAQPGLWTPRTDYTILTAAGGVSGTFASVSSNLAFLTPVLSYSANAVSLSLQRNDILFATVAQTPNQKAAAAAAESLGWGTPVYNALVKLDAPTARGAYDQLAGEIHDSTRTAIIDDDRYVREAINNHLLGLSNGANGLSASTDSGVTAWSAAWGHWGSHDGDGNAAPLKANGSGLLIGADLPIGASSRVGAVIGTGQSTARINTLGSSSHAQNKYLGVYGSSEVGALQLQGGAAYGRQTVSTNRGLAFGNFAGQADSRYHANTTQAYADASYPMAWGHATLAPFVNLAYERLHTDAIREIGTAAALDVSAQSTARTYGTLGLRGNFVLDPTGGLRGHASMGWQHAWGDTASHSTMRFAGGGGEFDIAGVPVAHNAMAVTGGLSFPLAPNVALDVSYSGQFARDATDQAARMSLTWVF
ncbi:ESPR-type extended signal peptide-containing protein [Dyella tabacisoli]|uniref:ESPR-type extended signal peptide-containing protein n=1 Tax=Dyella tabacisoli TaxID=2282381 RepID=UPI0013B3827C|nr:ESPR-type extended signal peptide-containing protein [Dyella tabacisoli]